MPRSLKRYYGSGGLHYVTCSCYQRKRWLGAELFPSRRLKSFLDTDKTLRRADSKVVISFGFMRATRGGASEELRRLYRMNIPSIEGRHDQCLDPSLRVCFSIFRCDRSCKRAVLHLHPEE